MARILLQVTIPYSEDDWHIGRFSRLGKLLEDDGHDVTARNREPLSDGSDPVLARLSSTAFDQLWLIAADTVNGLAPADVRGILKFREKWRGILTARDRKNTGASLLNLGTVGSVNNFIRYNRRRGGDRVRDNGEDTPAQSLDYLQRIVTVEPVHEVLKSKRSPSGRVEFFPAHAHEPALSVPHDSPCARVIAVSTGSATARGFNLAVAIEEKAPGNGRAHGRAIALSSFRQLADSTWSRLRKDPQHFEIYMDYIRNIARWLSPADV